MSGELSLGIKLTEGQINNAIAVAIAEALTPEAQLALITNVVRAHLSAKANSYERETILGKAVGDLIRTVTCERMKAKIQDMRPQIEAKVDATLGPQFRESVLSSLENAMGNLALHNVRITAQVVVDEPAVE